MRNRPLVEHAQRGRSTGGRFARGTTVGVFTRFEAGNTKALKHGKGSAQVRAGVLPDQAEALAALAERRARIEADCGGADALSELQRDSLKRLLELGLVGDYLWQQIATTGPLTAKGAKRAALNAYLLVTAQEQKQAQALGLERRAKCISDPLAAVRSAIVEANR